MTPTTTTVATIATRSFLVHNPRQTTTMRTTPFFHRSPLRSNEFAVPCQRDTVIGTTCNTLPRTLLRLLPPIHASYYIRGEQQQQPAHHQHRHSRKTVKRLPPTHPRGMECFPQRSKNGKGTETRFYHEQNHTRTEPPSDHQHDFDRAYQLLSSYPIKSY